MKIVEMFPCCRAFFCSERQHHMWDHVVRVAFRHDRKQRAAYMSVGVSPVFEARHCTARLPHISES
jgi:hypothetical protein